MDDLNFFRMKSIIDLPIEGRLIRALTFSHGVGLICAKTQAKLCTAALNENLLFTVTTLRMENS